MEETNDCNTEIFPEIVMLILLFPAVFFFFLRFAVGG